MKSLFKGEMPGLVLFDLDGTLLDSVPDLALATDQMLQTLGRPPAGEEQVRSWVGNGAPMLVKRALSGQQEPSQAELDQTLFDQAFPLFLDFYGNCCAAKSQLYAGVREFLDQLVAESVTMGLITNKPIGFTEPLLEEFRLQQYFSIVLGGDSLEQKKPDPLPLLHAMQQLQINPEQTLMVGDSRSDIHAARAAGCPVVAVSYGYNHGEPISGYQPDLIVDNLLELI
ncbi:phosphoglycolate phosphatase [Amphritea sp. HPY]|uniref:phosphoglycolate phosphatase n=1 Tax=Amphritea sp. HPY TaxID=3421652 RepID=UPI003D7CC397